jgi:hypothetical protein
MDLLTLGLDMIFIAGIVIVVKVATMLFDPAGKLARWYPLAPLIVSAPLAVVRYWALGWQMIVFNAVVFGFAAAWVYKTGKTTILGQ